MIDAFGVIPDGREQPVAMFSELEDALDWAMQALGSDRFTIQLVRAVRLECDEPPS